MSHNAKLDRLSMDAVQRANSGHPGTAMAMAPVVLHTLAALPPIRPGRSDLAGSRSVRPLDRAMPRCCSTRCCTSPASER
jgi:hypothetical protein